MPEEISAAGKMNFAQRIDISACWLGNGTDWSSTVVKRGGVVEPVMSVSDCG